MILGLAVLYVARPIWDIDLFWHIAAGRAFLADGGLPTTDIFSAIDQQRTWITFQWGYEVLVFALEALGGLPLVRLVHGLAMWLAFALFVRALHTRFRFDGWTTVALVALLIVLFGDRVRVRPHVFNILGWVLLLPDLMLGSASLERSGRCSRPLRLDRAAWIRAALVMAIWANLHAGGAFLFLVAAATLPVSVTLTRWLRWPESSTEGLRDSWIWYGAALVPALLAPNFILGNVQALTMLEGTESAIGEWWPSWHFLTWYADVGLESHLVCGALPTLLLLPLAYLAWRCVHSRGRDVPFRVVLLGLALLVLGHRSVRFVYVGAFALALMAPWLQLARPWPAVASRLRAAATITVSVLLVLVAWDFNIKAQAGSFSASVERAFEGPDIDEARFPVELGAFLEETGFEGDIFCQANWGGYLLWRLHPGARVTADGRGNYPSSVTDDLGWMYDRQNMLDPSNGPEALRRVNRYPVDAVVHQHPVWPRGFRPPPDTWIQVLANRQGAIWIRNTPKGQAYLEKLKTLKGSKRGPASPR